MMALEAGSSDRSMKSRGPLDEVQSGRIAAQAQLTGLGSPAARLAGALDLYRILDHRPGRRGPGGKHAPSPGHPAPPGLFAHAPRACLSSLSVARTPSGRAARVKLYIQRGNNLTTGQSIRAENW
jgi:hypothetical protein